MCGRYVRTSPVEVISEEFGIRSRAALSMDPDYNIAPSRRVIIVLNDSGEKRLAECRWGFLPSWAKDVSIGSRMINARAETVAAKPSFKSAFEKKRCLVIADGFYEWQKAGNIKTPVYIHLKSGRPFGFAGLYNVWTSPMGENTCTCTIITTAANALLEPVHDRMPVILPKEKEDFWLDPDAGDQDALLEFLKPYPSKEMAFHTVSTRVNKPGYNAPDAIKPEQDIRIRRGK